MGEARVCVRCGTPARADRFSCNDCGGAVVYVSTPDSAPAPAYAPAPAPSAPSPDWAPPSPTPQMQAAPMDGSGFVPGEVHIAPELRRRTSNAVKTANVLSVLVVIGLIGLGAVGWSVFGPGADGGGSSELSPYVNGSGGQVYTTSKFTVRLPNDYTVSKFNVPVGGYDVAMTGAIARIGDARVGVASGSMGGGATSFAGAQMPSVGRNLSTTMNLGSERVTVKSISWHGRDAFDMTASSKKGGKVSLRLVVIGNRLVVFIVASPKNADNVMRTLTDSYRDR